MFNCRAAAQQICRGAHENVKRGKEATLHVDCSQSNITFTHSFAVRAAKSILYIHVAAGGRKEGNLTKNRMPGWRLVLVSHWRLLGTSSCIATHLCITPDLSSPRPGRASENELEICLVVASLQDTMIHARNVNHSLVPKLGARCYWFLFMTKAR